MDKRKRLNQALILIVMAVLFITAVPIVSRDYNAKKNKTASTESGTEAVDSTEKKGISTYTEPHEELTGKKAEIARDRITEALNEISGSNSYIQVQVGDSKYDTYIYNKNGEAFGQASSGDYSSVYRKDGTSVKYSKDSEKFSIGQDVSFVDILNNVVDATKENDKNIKFYRMTTDLTDGKNKVYDYRIDLQGADAIKKAYGKLAAVVGDSIIDAMKESIGKNWEPHLIYCFSVSGKPGTKDSTFVACCYIIYNESEYMNWIANGYIELDDWALDEKWYDDDALNKLSGDEAYEYVDGLVKDLENIIQKFADDNGIDLDTTDNTEGVENETESTESSTESDVNETEK